MRLSAAVALSLFLLSPLALAQSAAPAAPVSTTPPSAAAMQLALKLYDDTHVDGVFDSMTATMIQNEMNGARSAAGDKASCAALQPPVAAFVAKMKPTLANLADPAFRQSAATIYAQNLSETELRDVTNFLESSAGKKWNTVSSQISQQIFALASEKAKPRSPQIQAAMTEFETSFRSSLATCPSSAAPAQGQAPKKKH